MHITRPAGYRFRVPYLRNILWDKKGPAGSYRKGEIGGRGYTLALSAESDSVIYGNYLYIGNASYNSFSKELVVFDVHIDKTQPTYVWGSKDVR